MMVTITTGGPSKPAMATAAPRGPPKRCPKTTEKFTTFGPGRNCASENASLNSSAVIQRRRSTIIRRAHGNAPPKPEIETPTNEMKSSDSDGWWGLVPGTAMAESDIGQALACVFESGHSNYRQSPYAPVTSL